MDQPITILLHILTNAPLHLLEDSRGERKASFREATNQIQKRSGYNQMSVPIRRYCPELSPSFITNILGWITKSSWLIYIDQKFSYLSLRRGACSCFSSLIFLIDEDCSLACADASSVPCATSLKVEDRIFTKLRCPKASTLVESMISPGFREAKTSKPSIINPNGAY
mmetsp:Transcript_17089/g.39454  ORF Transcript_17089/g.39454 Transcript_17089/m.39454 type:complete len:168 (-) Transcript_17089:1652-2155(-)